MKTLAFARFLANGKVGCLPFFFICLIMLFKQLPGAEASEETDRASGVSQAFTEGYAARTFAEAFHKEATYGVPLVEESLTALSLKKRVEISSGYEANVFSSTQDAKDDVIMTYSLPLSLSRGGTHDYEEFLYTISNIRYIENNKLNRVNHNFGTRMKYKTDKLLVTFKDDFTPSTAVAVGERSELKSASSSRVTTLMNTGEIEAVYDWTKKLKTSVSYSHSVYYFPPEDNSAGINDFSTQSHSFGPTLSYQWTPKTRLLTNYRISLVDYISKTQALDSVTQIWMIGAAGKLAPKTGYTVDFGVVSRDFRHEEVAPHTGYQLKAALTHRILPKVSWTMAASRHTLVENLDAARSPELYQIANDATLNVTWLASRNLTLSFGAIAGFTDRDGLITEEDPHNDTLSFTREVDDDYYQWDTTLRWAPRPNMFFILAYNWFNKNSTFKNFEYDNQRITASMNYQF